MGKAGVILVALLLGAAAGGGSCAVLQAESAPFLLPERLSSLNPPYPPGVDAEIMVESARVQRKNAAYALAVVGGSLGFAMGLTTGLAAGSLLQALAAALVAGVVTAAMGVAGGTANAVLYQMLAVNAYQANTLATCAAHGAGWAVLGVGLALALATFRGPVLPEFGKLAFVGVAAGAIAGLFFAPAAAAFFPLEQTELPVPQGTGNLSNGSLPFWTLLPCCLLSLAIGRTLAAAAPPPKTEG